LVRPAARSIDYALFAFGTLVELTYFDVSEQRAMQVVQLVDAMYQRRNRDWHAWQRGHLMDLSHAIAEGRSITEPAILELIRLGQHYEQISRGLFNAAIGNRLNILEFQWDERPDSPPPEAPKTARARGRREGSRRGHRFWGPSFTLLAWTSGSEMTF
jgi:thiamine biosynthesis lipoprotein